MDRGGQGLQSMGRKSRTQQRLNQQPVHLGHGAAAKVRHWAVTGCIWAPQILHVKVDLAASPAVGTAGQPACAPLMDWHLPSTGPESWPQSTVLERRGAEGSSRPFSSRAQQDDGRKESGGKPLPALWGNLGRASRGPKPGTPLCFHPSPHEASLPFPHWYHRPKLLPPFIAQLHLNNGTLEAFKISPALPGLLPLPRVTDFLSCGTWACLVFFHRLPPPPRLASLLPASGADHLGSYLVLPTKAVSLKAS